MSIVSPGDVALAGTIKREHDVTSVIARGHFLYAKHLRRWHLRLAVIATVLATFSGSSLLAGTKDTRSALGVAAAVAAFVAAVISGAQGVLRLSERSELHKAAGANFARLAADATELDLTFTIAPSTPEIVARICDVARSKAELSADAPDLPDKYYDRAKRERADDDRGSRSGGNRAETTS
jgi:hypothetical protein